MKHWVWRLLLVLSSAALTAAPLEAQVKVAMEADAQRITVADQVTVTVQVTLSGSDQEITPSDLQGEGFQLLQRATGSSSNMSFSFGGRNQSRITRTFSYVLKPTGPGTLRIQPAKVVVDGKEYKSVRGLAIEVTPIPEQDFFLVEMTGPSGRVYIDQEFPITLKVVARRLTGANKDYDPFPNRGRNIWPHLTVPWMEKQDGFQCEEFKQYAQRVLAQDQSGFPINNYSVGGGGFFDEGRMARFRLERKEVTRKTLQGKEVPYYEYTLSRRFRATKTGQHKFAPVTGRGIVFVETGQEPRGTEILAQSTSVELEVLDPPTDGRPPCYSGAVGSSWKIAASVSPSQVWVGEPVTVTLTVSGDGNLEIVGPPSLQEQEGLGALFRFAGQPETGTVSKDGRSKLFKYQLRPVSPEITAVPALSFAYFNPANEGYEVVRTDPLPLKVEKPKASGQTQAVFDMGQGQLRSEVKILERTLFPIHEKPDALETRAIARDVQPLHVALLAAPPLLSIGVLLLRKRKERREADPGAVRARGALRRALKALDRMRPQDGAADPAEGLARVAAEFVGERLQVPSAGMTAGDAMAALTAGGADESTAREVGVLFDCADRIRYGIGKTDRSQAASSLERARDLFRRLDRTLRARGVGR